MIKVLMVCNNFRMNGISTVIMNYIRNMDLSDIKIDIFAGEPINDSYVEELKKFGCIVFRQSNRKKHPINYYINLLKVAKTGYDCMHIHTNSHTCLVELVVARCAKIKVKITHSHSKCCQHRLFHELTYFLFSKMYTIGLACSEEAGIHLYKNREFTVLNNGINPVNYMFDEDKRKELRQSFGIPDNGYVIGHVGLFNEVKNQEFLIQVCKEILKKDKTVYLLFVGGGSKQDRLKQIVYNEHLQDRIIFLNERCDANIIYNIFDLFCFPSIYEGLGIVLIEAESNGLECIASIGVPKVTNISGRVRYLELNQEQWYNAIIDAKNSSVRNRKEDSSNNIRRITEAGYNITTTASKLKEIYFGGIFGE